MPISEYSKLSKQLSDNSKQLSILQKDNRELKIIIKNLEKKINLVLDKIQDFEVVFDAAELIEDQIEKQDKDKNKYNTEWNPYDDEDFEPENYENYDEDDDDDDVVTGY